MYKEIIEEFWEDDLFPTVFATIMILRTPLSVAGLASLLDLTVSEIFIEIFKIQSILVIPADDNTPVDVVHTSLRDFAISQKRSGTLTVTPRNQLVTANHCLNIMSTQSEEVAFQGGAAIYAVKHWVTHLGLALEDPDFDSLLPVLKSFVAQSFKTWFNSLLNKGKYSNAESQLAAVIERAKVSPPSVLET